MSKNKTQEQKILETALEKITTYLQKQNIILSKNSKEERINSANNEDEIIEYILKFSKENKWMKENKLKIGSPNISNNREWFDFSIESTEESKNNYFMPINIKVTNVENNCADNLNCKMGIFYALTGILPSDISIHDKKCFNNETNWNTFFQLINQNMAKNKTKDYYFLIVNKKNTSDIFWTSLKSLKEIRPNGNNLPFQCSWNKNRERIDRSYNEARTFILDCFLKSIEKRESIGNDFRLYLSNYIKKDSKKKTSKSKSQEED